MNPFLPLAASIASLHSTITKKQRRALLESELQLFHFAGPGWSYQRPTESTIRHRKKRRIKQKMKRKSQRINRLK